MLDRETALKAAEREVDAIPSQHELAVWDDATEEVPEGWVVFFQARKYLEDMNDGDFALGPPPLLVDRQDGSSHWLTTSPHWSLTLEEYRRNRDKSCVAPE